MKRSMTVILLLALCFSCLCPGVSAAPSDTEDGAWYHNAVDHVLEAGIMTGVGNGLFDPYGTVTRATVYQTFYSLAGSPEATGASFDDVSPDDWFAGAAAWTRETGLSAGTGAGFEGTRAVTRAELAAVFSRYMELLGVTASEADLTVFSDADAVPAWAEASIKIAVGAGIISGREDGRLDPDGQALRAELAQMHYAFSPLLGDTTAGVVALVDKYGNLTLDLYAQNLFNAGFELGDMLTVYVGGHEIEAPLCTAYSDVDTGGVVVRAPSGIGARNVIIAVNMGSFAETYGVQAGDAVSLALKEKAGYLNEYELRQLTRTDSREDYASDEIFANFRSITLGDIAEGVLYRSSSPVNNEIGRAAYADALAEAAGISTAINLANSLEELESYFATEDFASPYYKGLYDGGSVIYLDMGVDLGSEDFNAKLKTGLEFILESPGPYLIHCNEGKDRAGFAAMVLEALMGASAREIMEDYMVTYVNYYHVEYGSEQYERIGDSNILESLRAIAGLSKGADLSEVDLADAAEEYLLGIGLTEAQIADLKLCLSTPVAAAQAEAAA